MEYCVNPAFISHLKRCLEGVLICVEKLLHSRNETARMTPQRHVANRNSRMHEAHTRMHHGKKTSWWRQCDAWGDVQLGAHPRVLPSPWVLMWVCDPYLSTDADHVHPCTETELPDDSGLIQLGDVSSHQAKIKISPPSFQDLMDLLPPSYCQVAQHSFRALVEGGG